MEGKKERIRKKNNAKFSGHYVRPHTHNVRANTLSSHQKKVTTRFSRYQLPVALHYGSFRYMNIGKQIVDALYLYCFLRGKY